MTDTTSPKYDLAVIGKEMAGMAAAVFAVNRGISTVIVGSLGKFWFTGGLIDLMGVHPIGSAKTWRDPWAAIEAVAEDFPGHPYACLRREDIKAALQEFYTFLEDNGLPYCSQNGQNSNLITAFGAIKTTHGVPQTMWPGVTALSRKAPCLIVDLQGLKGFSGRLLAERLRSDCSPIMRPSKSASSICRYFSRNQENSGTRIAFLSQAAMLSTRPAWKPTIFFAP
jgi:glycerol-3-phosphate dehydrogenase subunit B